MSFSRRDLLKGTGITGLSCNKLPGYFAAYSPFLALDVQPRKAISGLSENELGFLKSVYWKWFHLPDEDPLSRISHQNVHKEQCMDMTGHGGQNPGFSGGVHGNWNFLPWHRCFIHFHEQALVAIAKKDLGPGFGPLTIPDGFRLPYWDWDKTPRLPPHFADAEWPLSCERSVHAVYDQKTAKEQVTTMLSPGSFDGDASFGGGAEVQGMASSATPHVGIHALCSKRMRNPDSAASDPLFFLHHANIDRIWEIWAKSQKVNISNVADYSANFRNSNHLYDFPLSQGSSKYSTLGCLSAASLGYRYDSYETPGAVIKGDAKRLTVRTDKNGLSSLTAQAEADLVALQENPFILLNYATRLLNWMVRTLFSRLGLYLAVTGARVPYNPEGYLFYLTTSSKEPWLLGAVTPFISSNHAMMLRVNASFSVDPSKLLMTTFRLSYVEGTNAQMGGAHKPLAYDSIYLTARFLSG